VARQAAASRTQEERTVVAKERLRKAALELFAADGYEATTLAAISLKAGYSRTLAQYHYADKSSLALELIEDRLRRDNQVELLDCPDDAPAETAWQALMAHLEATTKHYGLLHGRSDNAAMVRGEMAIHAAALMGNDPRITAKVDSSTRDLIARIERLLEISRRGGLIPEATDTHAMAVLHVHSIWGLALALFANPKAGRQIEAALRQIRVLLEALHNDI
jgi:AcrR family transcriptional regulator